MKQEYIRQVGRRLRLRRKQKTAVLRDLEEIFASAYEHGETEEQVIQRLGPPSEYAASVEGQLPSKGNGLLWAGSMPAGVPCVHGAVRTGAAGVGAGGGHRFCPGDHGNPGGRGIRPLPSAVGLGRPCAGAGRVFPLETGSQKEG